MSQSTVADAGQESCLANNKPLAVDGPVRILWPLIGREQRTIKKKCLCKAHAFTHARGSLVKAYPRQAQVSFTFPPNAKHYKVIVFESIWRLFGII